jgi:hypothetical protein
MHDILALVWLNILQAAFWATVVAATIPNIGPFLPIIRTAIIVDELPLRHFSSSQNQNESYQARSWP